ncbi:MAG: ribbon-helix-helix domain-containing protein, partial [Cyanobacteriota bacterium]
MDTTLDHVCTLFPNRAPPAVVATRQTSSSGRPKSPRIQVVLPEDLCERLSALAELES